jgi:hypothetical protein
MLRVDGQRASVGYLPHRWPSWFDPVPLDLIPEQVGPFTASARFTPDGAISPV